MDPNETLKAIECAIQEREYGEAAEFFDTLNAWLRKGGFLPDAWTYKEMVEQYTSP